MNSLLIIIGLLVLALLVLVFALFLAQHKLRLWRERAQEQQANSATELQSKTEALQALERDRTGLVEELQSRREELASLKTSLEMERKQFGEKMDLLNDSREQLTSTFKNIANEIFEDKSRKFTVSSKEAIGHVLAPLQDKISRFEKRVEETYDKESKQRFSLANEIKSLQELNLRISEDAVNLTNALKGDNKTQGNWGEFILESLLEKSGLVKGREYEVQVSLRAEDGGKSQPDVVVHLPESRDIIIDSKVSLKAWDEYTSTGEGEARTDRLNAHVQSVRMHVRGLSSKDYQNLKGVNTLDYVFLFMPIESAYSEATRADPDLLQFAYDRNIIFVGPSTLLTALKMVQNLWRLAQQNKNANDIAIQAGRLYDKFVAFVADLDEVGQRIDSSRKSFDKAFGKLSAGRGNLIRRTEALKELGAKTSKQQNKGLVEDAKGGLPDEDEPESLPGPADADAGDGDEIDDTTTH